MRPASHFNLRFDGIRLLNDDQPQQRRRMVTRPPCPSMGRAREAKVHQIKLVDKKINVPEFASPDLDQSTLNGPYRLPFAKWSIMSQG